MNFIKYKENMDFKNFFLRLVFSFLFFLIYLVILSIDFLYVYYLILIIYFLVLIEILFYFIKFKLLPIFYVLLSLVFFMFIDFNDNIYLSFNLFILSVILFDILSYIFGKIFGKNQLINISPNKTVEGFIGGFVMSFFICTLIIYFFETMSLRVILFILVIILSAFFGDIIQSYFKRKNNLKNSSEFIPGHGGVFDRFDSFLFSIIFYSISINFLL